MGQRMSLDDVELVSVADRLVELAQEMRVARIRPVHRLELEAEIVTGGFRVERTLRRYQSLVQQEGIGPIREEMAKIEPVGRSVRIERDAGFDMAGNLESIPPRGGRLFRFEHGRKIRRQGGGPGSCRKCHRTDYRYKNVNQIPHDLTPPDCATDARDELLLRRFAPRLHWLLPCRLTQEACLLN